MADSIRSDRFVPFTKSDVIAMCMQDAQQTGAEVKGFRDFYQILEALLHKNQLDDRIGDWLAENWNCHIDFEIGDAVNKLQRLNLNFWASRKGAKTQRIII